MRQSASGNRKQRRDGTEPVLQYGYDLSGHEQQFYGDFCVDTSQCYEYYSFHR